jgi:hypothetical protein
MRFGSRALVLLLSSVASSAAFAQSAEETAALLDSGFGHQPNEERISEKPLTFRQWLDPTRSRIQSDITFEQIDGCRYRITKRWYDLGSNRPNTVYNTTVRVTDYSKVFYPPTTVESGPLKGGYLIQIYPGASCRIQEDGSSECDTGTYWAGINYVDLSVIQAAVKYMNDKFCKTRAF